MRNLHLSRLILIFLSLQVCSQVLVVVIDGLAQGFGTTIKKLRTNWKKKLRTAVF